jgi:hypothetical protein
MYTRTGRISHTPNPTVVLLPILGLVAACSGRVVECARNSDCADSAVASQLKCPFQQVYCLKEQCKGGCGELCTVLRPDLNPCLEGICKPSPLGGDFTYCTMLPIPCQTAADCPLYLPPLADGGQSSWTCEDQICRYPGFEYPTN